ncbi:MAG: hypothetical protein WC700_14500 [Gemmatimonadaceae bacterium]
MSSLVVVGGGFEYPDGLPEAIPTALGTHLRPRLLVPESALRRWLPAEVESTTALARGVKHRVGEW